MKRKLGITEQIEEKRQDDSVTPSDVFSAIIHASRQFDLLLMQRLSASVTFEQVTLATNFMVRLLAQFPEATQMSPTPALQRGKRPVDVYNLLIKCYAQINAVAGHSGIEILKIELPKTDTGNDVAVYIVHSDVFDMAILLVSELSFFHAQLKHTDPPTQAYDPSFKVPAHVFQRGELLLHQLIELETFVKANPEWLTR